MGRRFSQFTSEALGKEKGPPVDLAIVEDVRKGRAPNSTPEELEVPAWGATLRTSLQAESWLFKLEMPRSW